MSCGDLGAVENENCRDDVVWAFQTGRHEAWASDSYANLDAVAGVDYASATIQDYQRLFLCDMGSKCSLPPCTCTRPPCDVCPRGTPPPSVLTSAPPNPEPVASRQQTAPPTQEHVPSTSSDTTAQAASPTQGPSSEPEGAPIQHVAAVVLLAVALLLLLLFLVWRRSRAKALRPSMLVDVTAGDLEMVSADSSAVAGVMDRVRFMNESKPEAAASPSVLKKAMNNVFALKKLREGKGSGKPCEFCGLDVNASEGEKYKGKLFHSTCFRCANCSRSLTGLQFGQVDDCLYCDERSRSCLKKIDQRALAALAVKEGKDQRMRTSEVALVAGAQKYAVEVIGDELEEIISNMAPKCAVCGGVFTGSDELIMQGMVKLHKDCLVGKQSGKVVREAQMSPAKACASTPGKLILKLQPGNGKRVMSFFMTRVPNDDKRATTASWTPDVGAKASNSRKCAAADIEATGASLRILGELGGDIAPPSAPRTASGQVSAFFSWEASCLSWEVRCAFKHESTTDTISATSVDLTIRALQ